MTCATGKAATSGPADIVPINRAIRIPRMPEPSPIRRIIVSLGTQISSSPIIRNIGGTIFNMEMN